MTRTRRISPHEWIQDYFSPVVGVMSSPEAEFLCRKNNLTLVELLQPFSKLLSDVTLKDPEGANHPVPGLNVLFQDHRRDPARTVLGGKAIADAVGRISEEPLVRRTFGEEVLEAPGFTPWFDAWMKMTLASVPVAEHEFLRGHLGCVFAASAGDPDPVETLRAMTQQQFNFQHGRPSSSSSGGGSSRTYPQYLCPNILKYYLVVHDVFLLPDAKAQERFGKVQAAFGSSSCHLLQINSRSGKVVQEGEADAGNPDISDTWIDHPTSSHRFCDVEVRLASVVGEAAPAAAATKTPNDDAQHAEHPLAVGDVDGRNSTPFELDADTVVVPTSEFGELKPATSSNVALYINSNDVERIRLFVREFVIKGLVPHVEKLLRTLQEIVTNRKGRSLFNVGVKRWFGQSKPGAASGTSVIYGRDATELQVRKLGDLYFMFKLYKQAYNCFHAAKKDFQSDEAWNYYAGAAEMSALSQFMQGDGSKKYPAHYMEDSITKYLSVCQMPEFAVRATVFDALCLKYHGMFQEAALSYLRMTNEGKDLRSGLLLEQAAYCYLLCTQPLVRKYAFHIILAGYRFAKSGQKHHSSRSYNQGFQVYRGHQWTLSEDHILYSLGHQSLLLKDHRSAAELFNELLAMPVPNPNPLQQMCHLREFFIVHHLREKEAKRRDAITIPTFLPQESVVDLGGGGGGDLRRWQALEKILLEKVAGREAMLLSKTSQPTFGPDTNNSLGPQATVGEPVRIRLPVRNVFQTPLLLGKVHLLWRFEDSTAVEAAASNEEEDSEGEARVVRTHRLESVLVEHNEGRPTVLELSLTPLRPGQIRVVGVAYSLKAQFPHSEATDYTIQGKQRLAVAGPRLASTKEQKANVVYGSDRRFEIAVLDARPRLSAVVENPPELLLQGEIRRADLVLVNESGPEAATAGRLGRICLVHTAPGMFSFGEGGGGGLPFEFPVVSDQSMSRTKDDGSHVATRLDILPLPLPNDGLAHRGDVSKVPLWMYGCSTADGERPEVYVYYEYDGGYRILKLSLPTEIAPSMAVSATRVPACVFTNDMSATVLVSVSNGDGRFKGRQLEQIDVWRVALLSRERRRISAVLSGGGGESVPPSESSTFCLRLARDGDGEGKKNADLLHVSHVKWRGPAPDGLPRSEAALPPLDFLKPGFDFAQPRGPNLKRDLVLVSWQGKVAGRADGVHGQTFVPLMDPAEVDGALLFGEDVADSLSARFAEVPTFAAATADDVSKECSVSVVAEKRIAHDFGASPIAMVPFEVVARNRNTRANAVFSYEAGGGGDGQGGGGGGGRCRLVGCQKGRLRLPPDEEKRLSFRLCVSDPGIYRFAELRFRVLLEEGKRPRESDPVPLQVAFIVVNEA